MLTSKDRKGIALLAVIIGVFLALSAGVAIIGKKPRPAADLCQGTPVASTVLLLDYSEEVSEQTLAEIVARSMEHVMTKVRANERVSIFTISDLSKKSLTPVLSLCKPPSEGNRLVEDVRSIEKRLKSAFYKPIKEALSVAPSKSRESPIAQALTDISLSEFLRGPENSLIVFSDMLENTDKFSLYGCANHEAVIAKYRKARLGALERPEFSNTKVSLHLIPRGELSPETIKCRDTLWTWFFGGNTGPHAGLVTTYLPGSNASSKPAKTGDPK